jgi:hypothetical protein
MPGALCRSPVFHRCDSRSVGLLDLPTARFSFLHNIRPLEGPRNRPYRPVAEHLPSGGIGWNREGQPKVLSEAQAVATVDRLIDRATILRFTGKSKRRPLETHGADVED